MQKAKESQENVIEVVMKRYPQSKIQTTSDYSKFKFYDFNRPVDYNRVEELKESMLKHGFISVIYVDKMWKVLDGQHRLEAAKLAKEPIQFREMDVPKEDITDVITDLNVLSKPMSDENFFHMWVTKKRSDYVKLKKYFVENDLNFFDGATLYGNIRGNNHFRNGSWSLEEDKETLFLQRVGYMNEIKDLAPLFKDLKPFNKALIRIVREKEYDHNRMIKKLSIPKNTTVLSSRVNNRPTNSTMYVEQLETIYNYHESVRRFTFSRTQN